MAGLIRLNHLLARSAGLTPSAAVRPVLVRLIATTPAPKEAAAAVSPAAAKASPPPPSANKNWVSYGFDFRDEAIDRSAMKASYFFSVTLCLVWGTFVWAYLPDPQLRNWAQREGHLTLRAREQAGLEPISPHYIQPSQIKLPSEQELAGVEIII